MSIFRQNTYFKIYVHCKPCPMFFYCTFLKKVCQKNKTLYQLYPSNPMFTSCRHLGRFIRCPFMFVKIKAFFTANQMLITKYTKTCSLYKLCINLLLPASEHETQDWEKTLVSKIAGAILFGARVPGCPPVSFVQWGMFKLFSAGFDISSLGG